MVDNEKFITHLAARCRAAYINERTLHTARTNPNPAAYHPGPRWDGGVDKRGAEHKPIWPKLAKFMIKNGLTPETCVRMRFAFRGETSGKAVLPNQIALEKYVDRYRGDSHNNGRTQQELQSLASETSCFQTHTQLTIEDEGKTAEDAWRSVLSDETLSLSPLFRHCVAANESLDNIAKYYHAQAVTQYLCAPTEYNEVWGKLIPDDFKLHAEALVSSAGKVK